MNHLLLFYLFLCFSAGIFSLGSAVFLYRRTGERLFLYYLYFYGAFSLMVFSRLLLAYAEAHLDGERTTLFFGFRYLESFLARYLVMLTLPLFIHQLFNLERKGRRNAIIAGITLITFLLQHLTEFVAGGTPLDQAGDVFEDAVFLALVGYCLIAGQRALPRLPNGLPRRFASRFLWLSAVFFPGFLHDAFLDHLSPIRIFPILYCVLGVLFTRDAFQIYLRQKRATPPKPFPDEFLNAKGISSREKEVLQLLLQGYSNARVAETLFISNNTVKTHARNIFRKLGVASRYELLTLSHQGGEPASAGQKNHPDG